MSPSTVVIGSVHMDLIASADRLPGPGESVSGGCFTMAPGGKGGNQAVQLALAGVETTLISRVGDDQFGHALRSALKLKGVLTHRIAVDPLVATGASTVLAAGADYSSIIAPGAADRLTVADLRDAQAEIDRADVVVLQWELGPEVVSAAIEFCAGLGKRIIFNASPSRDRDSLSVRNWRSIEWLVVNRPEASALAGMPIDGMAAGGRAAALLRAELGVANVVVTLGSLGSLWHGSRAALEQPPFVARVVDTVGAGDAYLGTLAAGLCRELDPGELLRRASAAGAIAVSRPGALGSLPTAAEIDALLA